MILEEQFPVPRYTAANKIDNSIFSLLWQLWCYCNPNHNKFSSSSDKTVVAIFPNLCLWQLSLCSNLHGRYRPWKTVSSHLKNRIHLSKSKIHQSLAIGHYFLCTLARVALGCASSNSYALFHALQTSLSEFCFLLSRWASDVFAEFK